jgi:hypothetical protein
MKRLIAALAGMLGLIAADVGAQVYIWKERGSNVVQMSGVAPYAYFDQNGPRVQLYIGDRLVDDTKARDRNPTVFREVQKPAQEAPKNRVIYVLTPEPEDRPGGSEMTIGEAVVRNRGAWAAEVRKEAERQRMRDEMREAARDAIRSCRDGIC